MEVDMEARCQTIPKQTAQRQLPISLPQHEPAEWWTWSANETEIGWRNFFTLIAVIYFYSFLWFSSANINFAASNMSTGSTTTVGFGRRFEVLPMPTDRAYLALPPAGL
jgi:hypothetical protein